MSMDNNIDFKEDFKNKIEKAKYIKKVIRNLVEKEDYIKAEEKIKEYRLIFSEDPEIFSIETVMFLMQARIDLAEKVARKGLKLLPFHFDLNYNLGFIYQSQGKNQEAIESYVRAKSVATTDEDGQMILDTINEMKKLDGSLDLTNLNQPNYKLFPLKSNDSTCIGLPLFEDEDKNEYYPLYYNAQLADYPAQLWNFYRTETLKGKTYNEEYLEDDLEQSLLPVATLSNNTVITLTIGDREYKFNDLIPKRFYYLPIEDKGSVRVGGNGKIIIGQPIKLKQDKKHDIKLILNLFVDGLAQEILEDCGFKSLMPNTYNFFKKGSIFTNCHSNAEWTLASVPTIFTGNYQARHKVFHPELLHNINDSLKSMGEYFSKDGYMTFQSCGNWRKTPSYGYAKGFDRMIYQSATAGSKAEEIIADFLEQIRSFQERDQFIWLSFFELHNVADNLAPKISSQINNSIESGIIGRDSKKSVAKDYDGNKIEKYINEIKRLDFYLKIIYDLIEEKYEDDEILISLFSDHGQSYIDEGEHILRDARTRVPFMIRGRNIGKNISSELMENVDILPTILEKASINFESAYFDGRLPKSLGGTIEKEYTYSESIYPGKTYKAIIRDNDHRLIFESEGNVEEDGRFELGNFSIVLENKLTNMDETEKYYEKVSKYFNIIIDHIGAFLKI